LERRGALYQGKGELTGEGARQSAGAAATKAHVAGEQGSRCQCVWREEGQKDIHTLVHILTMA
jgi:hypothetical protein